MITIHVHYIIFGCLLCFVNCQDPPLIKAQGGIIFESIGRACFPDKVLYSGQSDKVNTKELDEEVNALEFLTSASKWKKGSKKAVSDAGKIAVLAMHSWTFSLKPVFDGKVKKIDGSLNKITTEIGRLKQTEETKSALFKLEAHKNTQKAQNLKTQWLKAKAARKGASTIQRKLSRGLKGLRFLSQRLGPALGIFGSVFAIVSGFIDENQMQQQIDLLKKQMEKGFAKLRREMEQKYLELKDYVDDSVQFAQVVDLQAELQEMSNYYFNCANDPLYNECIRIALRIIIANSFRYRDFKFAPTSNSTRVIQDRQYAVEKERLREMRDSLTISRELDARRKTLNFLDSKS